MKIVYCIAGTCHSGGMERVLSNKANYLVDKGYEVVIVTTDQQGLPPFFSLDPRIRCMDLAIGYEENNGKSVWNKLVHYPFKQWKHRKRLTAVLMKEQPDVTISMFCNDAGFITKIKDGSVKLLEIHFSKFKRLQYNRKGLWRLIDRWRSRMDERVVRRFDRFVVLTEEDKMYWGNLKNMIVIPNASTFETDTVSPLTEKTVLAIGRFVHQKGFERLISAWKTVALSFPDWKLKLVGEGPLEGELLALIRDDQLEDCIEIVPPTKAVARLYQEASVLTLSSRYEGLPMVLLEAQTFGLPIVAFACKCGPRDIVREGVSGFLVEEGDVQGLAHGLMKVMADDSLRMRMGSNAKQDAARYKVDVIMRQWMDVFKEVTGI